ncbi:MAG: hypothetical protein LQ342_005834 [Letrouitia transgressa]|nr:MAG: hypothetical protein LQ342_005834 [Letrouitia transgressa]
MESITPLARLSRPRVKQIGEMTQEIRPRSIHGVTSEKWLGKRDNSVFDLRNQETFLWGAEGKTPPTVQDLI